MPLFNVRHAECADVGGGEFIQTKTAKQAVEGVNPLFRYAADEDGEGGGDHDSWTGIKPHMKHLKPVSGTRPRDLMAGTEPYMASVDTSHDYFWVYQVASLPAGATLVTPPKE